MLSFEKIIKSSSAYKIIQNDFVQGSVSHAYIFVSADRLCLQKLSLICASMLLCDKNDDEKYLVMSKKHPDVLHIPKDKMSVLTADVDEAVQSIYKTPLMADKKLIIFDYGETMNPSCQNKLLKTLEQPQGNAIIFINTSNLNSILPTIISRCKKIDVLPFASNDLRDFLLSEYPDNPDLDLAVSLSGGMIENAVNALTSNLFFAMFKRVIDTLIFTKSSKDILNAVSNLLVYKEHIIQLLGFFETVFRDIAVFHYNKDSFLICKGCEKSIELLSQSYSVQAIENIMPSIYHAVKRVKTNSNTNSVLDELVFSIVEKKVKYAKR